MCQPLRSIDLTGSNGFLSKLEISIDELEVEVVKNLLTSELTFDDPLEKRICENKVNFDDFNDGLVISYFRRITLDSEELISSK